MGFDPVVALACQRGISFQAAARLHAQRQRDEMGERSPPRPAQAGVSLKSDLAPAVVPASFSPGGEPGSRRVLVLPPLPAPPAAVEQISAERRAELAAQEEWLRTHGGASRAVDWGDLQWVSDALAVHSLRLAKLPRAVNGRGCLWFRVDGHGLFKRSEFEKFARKLLKQAPHAQ